MGCAAPLAPVRHDALVPRSPLIRARRRAIAAAVGTVLLAGVLTGCGSDAPKVTALKPAQVQAELAKPVDGLTPAARRLERAAGTVLPGPEDGAVKRLDGIVAGLRGTPVVVNLWGEWCVPCKKELPIFQRTALQLRGQVVFLGVATYGKRSATEAYLRDTIALPYPSIRDLPGDLNTGTGIDTVPKTFFYDRAGKRTVHQGPYETQADLEADIARYAR